jgi:hypothetical protein
MPTGHFIITATGKILIHRQTPERMIGKPAEAVAFFVERVVPVEAPSSGKN